MCLVQGGGRGIGLMIATGFVRNGAHVFIVSRDTKALNAAADSLNSLAKSTSSCGRCIAITADLSTLDAIKRFISELTEKQQVKSVHVLVNNSGVTWGAGLSDFPEPGWDRVLNLNVKSLFFLTQQLLPLLAANASVSDPARVVNIGSVVGIMHQAVPTYSYDTSKAAVHSLTKKLAFDLAERHITVNAIAPGYVPSKMSATLKMSSEQLRKIIPAGRMATATDMAGVALFLSSPAGSWISGAVIPVDGAQLTVPASVSRL